MAFKITWSIAIMKFKNSCVCVCLEGVLFMAEDGFRGIGSLLPSMVHSGDPTQIFRHNVTFFPLSHLIALL